MLSIVLYAEYCYSNDGNGDSKYCDAKVLKKFINKGNCLIKIKRKDGIIENWILPYEECVGDRMGDTLVFEPCVKEN